MRARSWLSPYGRRLWVASYGHDDLADLLVRLQVAVGLDDLLQRERFRDDWFETAVGQPRVDELLALLKAFGVCGDLQQDVAADRHPLAQHVEQRQRGRLRAQRPVEEDDPRAGRRLHELVHRGAADGVEHDAGALPAGDAEDLLHQVLLLGDDDVRRPGVRQRLPLRASAGQGHGDRADAVRDLDRGQSDAAGSRRDEDGIALPQLGDVDKRAVGGEVLHPDRRRLDERERRGVVRHGVDGGVRQVAVEAVLVQREGRKGADRVADLEAPHAWPYGGDGARGLVPEACGQLGVFEVMAPAEHRLGAVEAQRLDADLDLALARRWDLQVFDLKDFGAAGLVESHDARHVCLLLLSRCY